MNIIDILSPDAILPNLQSNNKKHAFLEIAYLAENILVKRNREKKNTQNKKTQNKKTQEEDHSFKKSNIFRALWDREILGPTTLENGIAVPRARLINLNDMCGIFAKLNTPIDFSAPDNKCVDLLFVLFVAQIDTVEQRRLLARISRLLSNENTINALRIAKNKQKIYHILTENAE